MTNLENYTNLHVHSHLSNLSSPDCVTTEFQLVERALSLGMKSLALTEHGNTLSKWAFNTYCIKAGIKPIHGVEAYFVKDINEIVTKTITVRGKEKVVEQKDDTNAHLLILAKNRNGLRQINKITSESFMYGFYKKPRIDIEMINRILNPKDIIITTACIAGVVSRYGESIIQIFDKFIQEGNFYLEVQPHNTELQINYNKQLLTYADKYNLPIVVGNDTHAIDDTTIQIRDGYVKSKKIFYDDENGWYVDFPTVQDVYTRLVNQNIYTSSQLHQAISNTNVIADKCESYSITEYELKIPVLKTMRHLSKEERYLLLEKLVYEKYNTYKLEGNVHNEQLYLDSLSYELGEIKKCGMADYFLLHYEIVNLAVSKYGGVITSTGRGSCVSYITNFFLGFTALDKLKFPELPLFADRFMSAERILLSKTAPDLDINVAEQEPFVLAVKELLGEDNSYKMIAIGLYQIKSAWKLFCRIDNIDPQIANDVSKGIENYEKDYKYKDEDQEIDVKDYIPIQYLETFKKSENVRKITDNVKVHPCSLILSPSSVMEEIGLISVGKEGSREIVAGISGSMAEKLGYLKSDILTVSVVDIVDKIYKKIGIPKHTPSQLRQLCDITKKEYYIYASGNTFEVNQFTSPRTVEICKEFIPSNIIELSLLVAAIRPSCISLIDSITKRKVKTLGLEKLDNLLSASTNHLGSYLIYQEQIMQILQFAGIPIKDTYDIIKAISKKKIEVIHNAKGQFISGMIDKLQKDGESYTKSQDIANELWDIIENSANYGFNAGHALSVAIDSLYIAFLKTNYFEETYSTLLEYYTLGKKRDVSKISSCKKELEKLNTKVLPIRIGQDNTHFKNTNNEFTQSILAVKGTNVELGEILKNIDTNSLIEIYNTIKSVKNEDTNRASCNKRHWNILCEIGYFGDTTNSKKASILIPLLYDKIYTKKQMRETSLAKLQDELGIKIDLGAYCMKRTAKTYYLDESKKTKLIDSIYEAIDIEDYTIKEKILNEVNNYGYLSSPENYIKSNIFTGTVVAISKKNNSIMINTLSGNNTWVCISPEEIDKIKRKQTIIIMKTEAVNHKGKIGIKAIEYITY